MSDEQCSIQNIGKAGVRGPWRCKRTAVNGFKICPHHRKLYREKRARFRAQPNQCDNCTRQVFGRVHCDKHNAMSKVSTKAYYYRNREAIIAKYAKARAVEAKA